MTLGFDRMQCDHPFMPVAMKQMQHGNGTVHNAPRRWCGLDAYWIGQSKTKLMSRVFPFAEARVGNAARRNIWRSGIH